MKGSNTMTISQKWANSPFAALAKSSRNMVWPTQLVAQFGDVTFERS
jgi:hypothetical protein